MNYTPDRLSDLTAQVRQSQGATAFLDMVRCKALGRPLTSLPDTPAHARMKAAVTSATLTGNTDVRATSVDILSIVQSQTLLGRMATVPAPPLTPVIDVPIDPVGGFVADSGFIPASMLTIVKGRTDVGKIAAIYGIVTELVKASDGRGRAMFDRAFIVALRRLEDRELLSTTAAVVGARPAGLLASAFEVGGGSPDVLETAIAEMFAFVSDGQPVRPYFITSPRAALWMALQRTSGGARFPNARVDGTGHIAGVPLLTSPAAGNRLVLVDAGKLVVSDDGLEVDSSGEVALQMNDSPTAGPANTGSAFQGNTAFVRIIRYLTWMLATDDAVAFTEIGELAGSPS